MYIIYVIQFRYRDPCFINVISNGTYLVYVGKLLVGILQS